MSEPTSDSVTSTVNEAYVILGLRALSHEIESLARRNGFWGVEDSRAGTIATKLALIHSELSEALEVVRSGGFGFTKDGVECMAVEESRKLPGYSHFGEELADVVIRTLDLAAHYGIDLGGYIVAKHNFNKGRAFKHGKLF